MTVKEFIQKKKIKQVEIACSIGASPAQVSNFINGWVPLPQKYEEALSGFLGLSLSEIRNNKVENIEGEL